MLNKAEFIWKSAIVTFYYTLECFLIEYVLKLSSMSHEPSEIILIRRFETILVTINVEKS